MIMQRRRGQTLSVVAQLGRMADNLTNHRPWLAIHCFVDRGERDDGSLEVKVSGWMVWGRKRSMEHLGEGTRKKGVR